MEKTVNLSYDSEDKNREQFRFNIKTHEMPRVGLRVFFQLIAPAKPNADRRS